MREALERIEDSSSIDLSNENIDINMKLWMQMSEIARQSLKQVEDSCPPECQPPQEECEHGKPCKDCIEAIQDALPDRDNLVEYQSPQEVWGVDRAELFRRWQNEDNDTVAQAMAAILDCLKKI